MLDAFVVAVNSNSFVLPGYFYLSPLLSKQKTWLVTTNATETPCNTHTVMQDPQYIPETDSTVEMAADGRYQVPLMRVLCRLLLHHLAGEQNDVRVGLQHLRQDLAQVCPIPS